MLTAFTKWNKHVSRPLKYVLTDVFGIGNSTARVLLQKHGLQNHYRFGKVGATLEKDLIKMVFNEDSVDFVPTNEHIKQQNREALDSLQNTRSYRGLRHLLKLPVRGQRSKTNARTQKSQRPINKSMQRTSYRNVANTGKSAVTKKSLTDSGMYSKTLKKRSRTRHCLQN